MSDLALIREALRDPTIAAYPDFVQAVSDLCAQLDRFRSERGYVIGCNDGFDAAACWLPIEFADKTITQVQDFSEVGITMRNSDRYWVRDEDGRVYEASWTEGEQNYWWDWEGESPVDPVEFMPHPLDPRWIDAECPTCNGTGKEARHQLCRDCDEVDTPKQSGAHPGGNHDT